MGRPLLRLLRLTSTAGSGLRNKELGVPPVVMVHGMQSKTDEMAKIIEWPQTGWKGRGRIPHDI